ncbi:MAG: PucR family transcriptional regulator [Actinomycetes bacterium]
MPTVREICDSVGAGRLEIVHGDGTQQVGDVVLVAPGDDDSAAVLERGDLALLVASPDDVPALPRLLGQCARAGAAGAAVTAPLARHEEVRQAAEDVDVCLLAVPSGTAWAQLVWLLVGLLDAAPGAVAAGTASGFGELFTFADALETALGGPVTIEDGASRVLAHSSGHERADQARLSTIVGRRVPADLRERFRSTGVLRKLQRSEAPVVVPSWGPGISPRLVIPVRAGRELLGSIWAAVDRPDLAPAVEGLQPMVSAVALQLLRLRAQEDLVGRLEADRLRAALGGSPSTGWQPPVTGPWRVVCLSETATRPAVPRVSGESTSSGRPAPGHSERWRSVLRWSGWRTPLLAEVDGQAFALVGSGTSGDTGSWVWMTEKVATGLLAASRPVSRTDDLSAARQEAARVMGLLLADAVPGAGSGERRLATAEDAWAGLVVDQAVRAVSPVDAGPVATLLRHDATRGTQYVPTLAASLRHPADPRAAAASLHVHPNTFRYRMRRLLEVVDLDLDDAQVRLALQLQLRAAERPA